MEHSNNSVNNLTLEENLAVAEITNNLSEDIQHAMLALSPQSQRLEVELAIIETLAMFSIMKTGRENIPQVLELFKGHLDKMFDNLDRHFFNETH